jgi:hypothetical protein
MSNDEPPLCETCNTQITVKHNITKCHKYQQERTNLNLTETLDAILGPNPDQNTKILTFLKLTNLMDKI